MQQGLLWVVAAHRALSTVVRYDRVAVDFVCTQWQLRVLHNNINQTSPVYGMVCCNAYLVGLLCTYTCDQLMAPYRSTMKENIRGFGSVSNDDKESITLKRDNAGDQFCLRMSMHIPPFSEMFM